MERIELRLLYETGAALSSLLNLETSSATAWDVYKAGKGAVSSLKSLVDTYPSLTVCRPAVDRLTAAYSPFEKLPEDSSDWTTSVESDLLKYSAFVNLIQAARETETVLTAELQTLETYHSSQKGIYSTTELIERADLCLPDSARERVPSLALEEIRQSGRCLAFDNSTAVAFHSMRAVEATLHEYYLAVCKPRPKQEKRLNNWGEYLRELDKSSDPGVQRTTAIVRQLKNHDRNPTMHPELQLTPDDAISIFQISIGAILAMAAALPKAKVSTPRNRGTRDEDG